MPYRAPPCWQAGRSQVRPWPYLGAASPSSPRLGPFVAVYGWFLAVARGLGKPLRGLLRLRGAAARLAWHPAISAIRLSRLRLAGSAPLGLRRSLRGAEPASLGKLSALGAVGCWLLKKGKFISRLFVAGALRSVRRTDCIAPVGRVWVSMEPANGRLSTSPRLVVSMLIHTGLTAFVPNVHQRGPAWGPAEGRARKVERGPAGP